MNPKPLLCLLLLSSLTMVARESQGTPGDLDTTFGKAGKVRIGFGGASDHIEAVTFQADGKVIAAGYAVEGAGVKIFVARYNVDGSPDASFGNDGVARVGFPSGYADAKAVAVQADGKILVAGPTHPSSPDSDFGLVRLNSDGSLDTSFGNGGILATDLGSYDEPRGIGIFADGKILLIGTATVSNANVFALVQYNADGSLDGAFGVGGKITTPATGQPYSFAFQTGNKILLAGQGTNGGLVLARYNSNGSLDPTFDTDGIAFLASVNGNNAALGIQSDFAGTTKIVVATSNRIVRFTSNGALDTGFGTNGIVTTPANNSGLIIQVSGVSATRILVSGAAANPNGGSVDFTLTRYLLSGTIDTAFGNGGVVYTPVGGNLDYSLTMRLRSNRIVVGGYTSDGASSFPKEDSALVAYNLADGSLDASFDGDGKRIDDLGNFATRAAGVAVQSDGKIVAVGTSPGPNSTTGEIGVARFNADGTLDPSFGNLGRVTTPINGSSTGDAIILQSDGKIVVAGSSAGQIAVARYGTNGALDPTFGGSGAITTTVGASSSAKAVQIQSDGKIIVGGITNSSSTELADFALVRYNSNGALDATFGNAGRVITPVSSGEDDASFLQIQTDGKILLGGSIPAGFALARYNSNGTLDQTFASFGLTAISFPNQSAVCNSGALQADGKILFVGYATDGTIATYALARLLANGMLDPSFDGDGRVTTQIGFVGLDAAVTSVIQPDGKIIAAGLGSVGQPSTVMSAVRYNSDGSLDNTFGVGGKVAIDVTDGADTAYCMALDASGRAVLGGEADSLMGLIRLQGSAAPTVVSAVSRKVHGSSGTYDIALPVTGTAGVECRGAGAGGSHQVVVTFGGPATVGSVAVASSNGQTTATASASGAVVTIDLGAVANAQTIQITLNNVTVGAATGNVAIPMSVLLGDTNGNGNVSAADIGQVKALSGQSVSGTNFRADLTVSGGSINASDIASAKAQSGTQLPAAMTAANRFQK